MVTGKQNANIQTNDGQYPFFSCSEKIGKSPQYSFDGESILIAGNGVIDVKYYHGKFEAYQRTYVLMPNRYFYLFLEKSKMEIEKLTNISQGSVIKFITKPMIEDISISLNEQSIHYDEKIGKLIRKISNLEKNNIYLATIKKNLLEKFFQ